MSIQQKQIPIKQTFGKIIQNLDGSYIIKNGTFHVPNNEKYKDLYSKVDEYAKEYPHLVTKESEPKIPSRIELINIEIKKFQEELNIIDIASIRPLRAKISNSETQNDIKKLEELETKAIKIRKHISDLLKEIENKES